MQPRYNETYKNSNLIDRQPMPYTWDEIRAVREPLLARADVEINKAQDRGDKKAEKLWRAYREDLRNVTTSFKTPDAVEFPVEPKGGEA